MTRLLVIHGTRAALYDGNEQIAVWDTKDPEWPFDKEDYDGIEPEVFPIEWLGKMHHHGRRFPIMSEALGLV